MFFFAHNCAIVLCAILRESMKNKMNLFRLFRFQNGVVLNQTLQPYEAHIPYILQFMMDYNLYGMNLINLNSVKYRHPLQGYATEESQSKSSMDLLDSQVYLPISVTRQSMCELEVDVHASDILNKQSVTEKLELNPGLAAIWNEEKARRVEAGLENAKSQLLYPKTPSKIILPPTSNDVYQEGQLLKRLNAISQVFHCSIGLMI